MQFETPRLILRDWYPTQDARHAMDIYGDKRVMRWMEPSQSISCRDTSIQQSRGRLERHASQARTTKDGIRSWAVVQKDIGRVIGSVGLETLPDMKEVRANHIPETIEDGLAVDYVEISWYFRPASWGLGYASEAASCLVQHSFKTLNLPLLLAVSHPDNTRSIALMKRLGMCSGGMTTRSYGGEPLLLYTLTSEQWHRCHASTEA